VAIGSTSKNTDMCVNWTSWCFYKQERRRDGVTYLLAGFLLAAAVGLFSPINMKAKPAVQLSTCIKLVPESRRRRDCNCLSSGLT